MATEKRLKILTEAEIDDLFGPPVLNHNDQRFFFTLNDHELAIAHKIRRRDQRWENERHSAALAKDLIEHAQA